MALTLGSSFGFQSTTTSGGGGGNSVIVKDEGVTLTSALASLNFVGAGVTASAIGNDVTVTINGGSGSGDLKADGTIPLTANWNVGAYEITANKFIGNNGFGFNVGLGGSLVSASTTGTAKTWTLPNTAGTIALTSDIPSLSGYLKADGTIPLTANWDVGAYEITANKFIGNNGFGFNIGLGGSLISASTTGVAKTWTLPNTTGTIALTSDIASPIIVKDEGTTLTSALASLNFVGVGVTASTIGNDVTVTINGSSGTVTSVGLSMPNAFSVTNSPITGSGTLEVNAVGLSSEYIRGDGQLASFPTSFGGGSTVDYFLNGSVNQGTFVGNTYYELGDVAITGVLSTNFTLDSTNPSVRFITDANIPDSLTVPNGVWTLATYLNQNNNTGQCTVKADLYKYDGVNFTLISLGATESISNRTSTDLYTYNIPIPTGVVLDRTDRLAIVITAGNFGASRTLTLHTEGNEVGQVHTTYSKGLTTLNGLTDSVQYFQVNTSGTSFNIVSSADTHTFNLPTASSLNSGALSNTDWTTFNNKGNGDLKADGTIPLTANWNVGAYEITANKFIGNNGFGFNIGLGGSLVSASTTGTAKTWTLPNTAGTIALTTDIPSLSGYLKADGTIPLTANWNVGAFQITANKFIGNNGFDFNVGLGGSLVSASTTVTAKTWTLPNITGTIALLNSPVFTGTPTVPSPSLSDNSSQIPNTAWITAKGYSRWFGIYNASTNTFTSPTESALPTTYRYGDFFTVSVAGTGNPAYGGAYYNVGDVWSYGKLGDDDVFFLATSIQTGTLSNYSSTTGTILPTDSVVSAISKLNGNIATGSTSYGAIFSQTTFNFLT